MSAVYVVRIRSTSIKRNPQVLPSLLLLLLLLRNFQ
jgi:hypothetical protein